MLSFFVSIVPHPLLSTLITLYKIKAGVRYRPIKYKVLEDAWAFRDGIRTLRLRLQNMNCTLRHAHLGDCLGYAYSRLQTFESTLIFSLAPLHSLLELSRALDVRLKLRPN